MTFLFLFMRIWRMGNVIAQYRNSDFRYRNRIADGTVRKLKLLFFFQNRRNLRMYPKCEVLG